jgi:hypothetical protein
MGYEMGDEERENKLYITVELLPTAGTGSPLLREPHTPVSDAKCGIKSAYLPAFELLSFRSFEMFNYKGRRSACRTVRMSRVDIVILDESDFPEVRDGNIPLLGCRQKASGERGSNSPT